MKDVKTVVAQLMKEGAQVVKGLTINNVNLKQQANYTRASLTLDRGVKAMVDDGTGNYIEGESNVIFVSVYSIAAILGSMEQTAFAKNILVNNPNLLNLVLSFAKIDVVLEKVTEGQEYANPFSNNATPTVVAHDNFYPHIVGITIGKIGLETLNSLKQEYVKRMLDGAFADAAVNSISSTVVDTTTGEVPF